MSTATATAAPATGRDLTLSTDPLAVTVDAGDLLDALNRAARIVSRRVPVPILAGVVLTGRSGGLTVACTDYDTAYVEDVPAPGATGTAIVSRRALADIVRVIGRRARVTLRAVDPKGDLDRVEITADTPEGRVVYHLAAMPAEEYPAAYLGAPTGTRVAGLVAGDLQSLARVVVAASTDMTLPILCAVRITAGPTGVTAIATDRYRLARQHVDTPAATEATVLAPAQPFAAAAAVLAKEPSVDLLTGDLDGTGAVILQASSRTVTLWARSDQDSGHYPKAERLIPATALPMGYTAPAANLAAALRRAAVVIGRYAPITLGPDGDDIVVRADDDVDYDAKVVVADAKGRGRDPLTASYNPGYLAQGVRAIGSGTVTLAAQASTKPVVLTGPARPGFTYLLMPVRLAPAGVVSAAPTEDAEQARSA